GRADHDRRRAKVIAELHQHGTDEPVETEKAWEDRRHRLTPRIAQLLWHHSVPPASTTSVAPVIGASVASNMSMRRFTSPPCAYRANARGIRAILSNTAFSLPVSRTRSWNHGISFHIGVVAPPGAMALMRTLLCAASREAARITCSKPGPEFGASGSALIAAADVVTTMAPPREFRAISGMIVRRLWIVACSGAEVVRTQSTRSLGAGAGVLAALVFTPAQSRRPYWL